MKREQAPKYLFIAMLIVALALQFGMLFSTYSFRVGEIYRAIGQTGLWRSANFTFGQRTANFYAFLNEHAPANSPVVVPVRVQGPVALMQQAYVEFFIQPRQLAYCEDTLPACLEEHSDLDSTVLIVDLQSVAVEDSWADRLKVFDEDWAILLPSSPGAATPWVSYSSIKEIILSSVPALFFLALVIIPGALLARRTLPAESFLLHLALGIGSGIAWLTFSLCIALLAGAPLTTGLLWGLVGAGWVLSLAIAKLYQPRHKTKPSAIASQWPALAILLVPITLAFVLSIGNGFTETDELILWGSKGVGISLLGLSEGATARGTLTTWYPLNVPLVVTSFLTLFGKRLPESKLVFPLFLLGSAGFAFAFLQKTVRPWAAILGSLLLATTPNIFYMSTLAHGNVPTMFYILVAVVLLHLSQTEDVAYKVSYWAWGTVFLLGAAWTRPEGLHLVWAITLFALLIYCRDFRNERSRIAISLGGLLGYTAFWVVASPMIYYSRGFTDSAFSTAFSEILKGDLNLQELGFIAYSLFVKFLQPESWGAMGIITLISLLIFGFTRKQSSNHQLLWLGLVVTAAVTAGFWLNTYTFYEGLDIGNWVTTSFVRLVLPGMSILWLFFIAKAMQKFWPKD